MTKMPQNTPKARKAQSAKKVWRINWIGPLVKNVSFYNFQPFFSYLLPLANIFQVSILFKNRVLDLV